jgi:hypothetical protein
VGRPWSVITRLNAFTSRVINSSDVFGERMSSLSLRQARYSTMVSICRRVSSRCCRIAAAAAFDDLRRTAS